MEFVITNAHVEPVSGEPFDGSVHISEGRIVGAGPDLRIPDGVEVVDAGGGWLIPGLVEAHGHVGIAEESNGWAGEDTNEGTDPNGARFRALDAIHPTDEGFRDALSGGVTTIVVKPGSASPIGGQTVAIKTWGRIVDEMVVKHPASMKSALGENPKRFYGADQKVFPKTRQGVATAIREAFTAARNYGARKAEAEGSGKAFDIDLNNEALLQVLNGDLPWCQHCHRVDDIATAIRLQEEFGYELIINHGTEAHLIADVLAEKKLPVVIGPLFAARSKQELTHRSVASPGRLVRAGVKIAITTDAPVVPINMLSTQASIAINEGLARDAALKSITLWAAEIMGLAHRVGSIEAGKDADLVLWTGDPLTTTSRATHVWIEGRQVYHYDESLAEGVTLDPYSTLGTTVAEPGRERR